MVGKKQPVRPRMAATADSGLNLLGKLLANWHWPEHCHNGQGRPDKTPICGSEQSSVLRALRLRRARRRPARHRRSRWSDGSHPAAQEIARRQPCRRAGAWFRTRFPARFRSTTVRMDHQGKLEVQAFAKPARLRHRDTLLAMLGLLGRVGARSRVDKGKADNALTGLSQNLKCDVATHRKPYQRESGWSRFQNIVSNRIDVFPRV
jgi:hypothetical protein